MAFRLLSPSEPLEVPGGQTGPLVELFVPVEAKEVYLRVIALWRDNVPLVGAAPTFHLKSGRDGEITAFTADGQEVVVPDDEGKAAAQVTCRRLPADTYLISISDISEDAGPWQLRISNNDSETLRFAWVSADDERDTLQPWMVLEPTGIDPGDGMLTLLRDESERVLLVRNRGTAPLLIKDEPGTPLGGSPVVLVNRPALIAPHDVDRLTVKCGEVSFHDVFEHVFESNDPDPAHNTLRFQILPLPAGKDLGPAPGSFCRLCGRCPEYLSPPTHPGGPCRRERCRHTAAVHFAVSPGYRSR